jgi:hypothetical protein
MKRCFFALALLLLASPAGAGRLYVHGVTRHIPLNNHDVVEFNPGLSAETDGLWRAGFYCNSYSEDPEHFDCKLSEYVAKEFQLEPHWRLGFGIATGYKFAFDLSSFDIGIREGEWSDVMPIVTLAWEPVSHVEVLLAPFVVTGSIFFDWSDLF